MAKYSYEFKKQVVMEYLNGRGSTAQIVLQKNMKFLIILKSNAELQRTISLKMMDYIINTSYSFEYKFHMVELYLASEDSLRI